ncbi:carcinoembryonic antigen-related cell adhesion molecule 5-like [Seriola dumerili]|uniref:carcinoembryonic antigen-related cell adhesion molecule 5-like n=1 Tax=Seriola dumerili TaxID=41447 RepID=UPI000BBE47FC|nr:carcinoembryonic antigen-related cell adhesion molecule 5-like [Seriola dumerili]
MGHPVAFLLILATVAFAPDYVCSHSLSASENPVPVGSNVTLYSQATNITGAWLFNNNIIVLIIQRNVVINNAWRDRVTFNSTGLSLTIKSLQLEDSGEYALQAVNDFYARLTLSVQVPISNVTLRAKATSLVEFNDTAVFMCSVSSGSSLSYVWMKGHDVLTAGGEVELSNGNATLTILNVTRYDEGPFKCNVSNGISYDISPPVYLNISYGPSNTTMTIMPMVSHYIYRTGLNITLSCSAMSSPPAMIKWMVNGVYMNKYGSHIQLVNVTESNSGNYKCVFHNTVTSRFSSASTMLWILDPLETVEVNHTGGPAILDQPFALHCAVTGSVDRIQWWRNGHLIYPNDTIVFDMNNKTLILNPVQQSDNGDYQCQAFNAVSNMTSSPYNVEVNYGPEMPTITGPTVVKTGYSVTFSCYASSHPPSHYRWYFNHYVVANTSKYVTPPLTTNMSGTYTCKAYNNVTGQNKTAYMMLTVVDPIKDVRVEAPMKTPIEGHQYMLHCNMSGLAEHIYWMKNDMKLQEDNTTVFSMHNKTVTFHPLKRYDTGYYSCKAMNAVGNMTSAPYQLLVNFGPETPDIDGPEFAETGKSVTFNCSAMSFPPSHFSWWFNGTMVASTSVFTTGLLTLNMSGEYTCMAYNNETGKNSTNSKMLTVIEAIKSVMIKNYTVPINSENFTLICEVVGPYDMIYWKKDNLLLNMNTSYPDMYHPYMHYHIENNMLHFTPVTLHSEGTYHCYAVNRAAIHSSPQYMLLVIYGPLRMDITGPDSVKPGDSVSLNCTVDSRPDCDFYWFFDNMSSVVIRTGSVITFPATIENVGNYTCKAMNPVTNITMYKTTAFTLNHASANHFPPQGGLMLMGAFALFVPMMFN